MGDTAADPDHRRIVWLKACAPLQVPEVYDEMLRADQPIEPGEVAALRRFTGRFEPLCHELFAGAVLDTVRHDDVHAANLYKTRREPAHPRLR